MRIKSKADADAAIARVGALDRELERIETSKAEAVARASAEAEAAAAPLVEERKSLVEKVRAWCEARRAELTDGGRSKTAKFPAGEVAWRMGRPRVVVDTRLVPKILATLRKLGLERMIRVCEEVDRTAVAKEPDAVRKVAGIAVEPAAELFEVKPVDAELAEARGRGAG